MIRKNNKQIKELLLILDRNSSVDAHLADVVRRYKFKTNFSLRNKKFKVKKFKKRNKSNKNTNNLILNF